MAKINKCIGDDTKAAARQSLNCIKNKKMKYGEKRFSIWRMEFLHPAMCHVARSRHWFRQVTAPCNVASGSGIVTVNSPCGSTAVDMSFCTSLRNFIQIGPPSAEKMTSCRFTRWRISAILDFRGPIMGCLKSSGTTSYRWSIDTIALNCLVFEKITFFLHFGDRQTNKQTNRRTAPTH